MTIVLNGTTGITNDGGYTGDGVVFADTTPANTLVTDTSGNVGIGTSSPTAGGKLDVNGIAYFGTGDKVKIYSNNVLQTAGTLDVGTIGSAALILNTANTERARIDSSGNLGLGVTPSAWGTAKAIQVGSSGFALSSNGSGAGDGSLNWNGYYNGTNWIYSYTGGAATRYRQNESGHAWFTAPSGTAGNAISFTQAMTLDSSGNLLVGTTSAGASNGIGTSIESSGLNNARITVNHSTSGSSNGSFYMQFAYGGTVAGTISQSSTTTVAYNTSSDYRLKENVQPMTSALAKVASLKPCVYTWKSTGEAGQGFIAHELAEVVPDCVTGEKDAVETYVDEEGNEQTRPVYQGIDTSFLVATLTAAIQELKAINDAQAETITALTARVTALEGA